MFVYQQFTVWVTSRPVCLLSCDFTTQQLEGGREYIAQVTEREVGQDEVTSRGDQTHTILPIL